MIVLLCFSNYKYYTSKYDLMDRYLNRVLEGFRRQVDVAFVNASPDTIQSLLYQKNFENTLTFLRKHKEEYTLLWSIPPAGKRLQPDGGRGA